MLFVTNHVSVCTSFRVSNRKLLNTQGDSDVVSSHQLFFRHDVGQALRNVCYCDITFLESY